MKWEDMTSEQLAEYYEKLQQQNYDWYQQSGEQRYDTKQYRYGKIAEAFRARAREEHERGEDMKKRTRNASAAIERLISNKLYTAEEVAKLLREAVWW